MAAQFGPDSANPASGERSKFTAELLGWSTRIRGEAVADTASKVIMVMRYMAGFCTWFGSAQILERHLFGVWDTVAQVLVSGTLWPDVFGVDSVVQCVWCGHWSYVFGVDTGPMCSVWTL